MPHSNAYGPFHGLRLEEFARIAAEPQKLTEAQADGRACLFCAGEYGAMVPIGTINEVRVWCHERCPEPPDAS